MVWNATTSNLPLSSATYRSLIFQVSLSYTSHIDLTGSRCYHACLYINSKANTYCPFYLIMIFFLWKSTTLSLRISNNWDMCLALESLNIVFYNIYWICQDLQILLQFFLMTCQITEILHNMCKHLNIVDPCSIWSIFLIISVCIPYIIQHKSCEVF